MALALTISLTSSTTHPVSRASFNSGSQSQPSKVWLSHFLRPSRSLAGRNRGTPSPATMRTSATHTLSLRLISCLRASKVAPTRPTLRGSGNASSYMTEGYSELAS